jgi:hypothetical protein
MTAAVRAEVEPEDYVVSIPINKQTLGQVEATGNFAFPLAHLAQDDRLTTALGVAILGGIKLAKERRAVEGNMAR